MGLDMYLEAHLPTNDELRALHTVASERLADKYNIDKEDGSVFVCAWDFEKEPDAEADVYAQLLKDTGLPRCEGSPMATLYADRVEVNVAYWRKANAVHRWFVDVVQGGVDECQASEVTRDQLDALRLACQTVLDNVKTAPGLVANGYTLRQDDDGELVKQHILQEGDMVVQGTEVAEELLPTSAGFFFGSTDYDEYYVEDLRDTVKQITAVLENVPAEATLVYRASW
jgi:hypothetical protein